jgi:hypothetical protein
MNASRCRTSLLLSSEANFYTEGKSRSTGFIFHVPAQNILAASGNDLNCGKTKGLLSGPWIPRVMRFESLLRAGVDSPTNCKKTSENKRDVMGSYWNEIVVQPEVSGGSICSITGGFVLENSPDTSKWSNYSQTFYEFAKERGLAVVRFWEKELFPLLKPLLSDDLLKELETYERTQEFRSAPTNPPSKIREHIIRNIKLKTFPHSGHVGAFELIRENFSDYEVLRIIEGTTLTNPPAVNQIVMLQYIKDFFPRSVMFQVLSTL